MKDNKKMAYVLISAGIFNFLSDYVLTQSPFLLGFMSASVTISVVVVGGYLWLKKEQNSSN